MVITLCFIIYILFLNTTLAETNQDILLQQRIENIKTQREIENAKKFKKSSDTNIKYEQKYIKKYDNNCIEIDKIIISSDSKKLKTNSIQKLINKKFKNQCLSKEDIIKIRDQILDFYTKKGYITTKIILDTKEAINKKLYFSIKDGILTDIEIKDEKLNKLKTLFLFPYTKNRPLNLKDIEQGLEQMNRLDRNNATMDIDDTKVIISNKKYKPFGISFDYDNGGSETNGIYQLNTVLNYDNLFGINDGLYVNYSDTLTNHNIKYSKSSYTSYSIPFGYWTFTTSYSNSEYFNITKTQNNVEIEYSGKTKKYTNSLDRVLFRNNFYKLNAIFDLETVDKTSKLRNTVLNNSTYKISDIRLSFNNTFNIKNGIIIIKPTIQKGIKAFNSKSDITKENDGLAKNDYKLYKLFIYYSKYIPFIKSSYNFQLNSQWTNVTLYSNNKISIGGEGTVRSFKKTSLSGDRGFYIKNEISTQVSNIVHVNKINFFNVLNKTKLVLFIDYGLVNDTFKDKNDIYDSRTGQMLGVGTSLKYNGKYTKLSITYAKGVWSSKFIETKYDGNRKEESIWFNIGVNY